MEATAGEGDATVTRTVTSEAPQDQWWIATLADLRDDMDALVDDFVARLQAVGSGYEDISASDIRATARETLTLLITELRGEPLPEHLRDLPQRLGVRRARQGVDRDRLLEAVRLDYRVLWAGLTRVVSAEDAALLVAHAEVVLSTVEDYISEVQVAFLNELDTLALDSRAAETRAIARLLAAERPEDVAAEVAEELGTPLDAEYEVVLVPSADAASAHRLVADLQHTRARFLVWDFDDGVLFVRPRADVLGRHPLATTRGVVVDEIAGLAGVAEAARLAHLLAPYASDGRLSDEHELWPPVAADALAPILPGLSPAAVAGLASVSPGDRGRLIDTFLAYCETGSVKLTAEAGFVHRNTVVNRLRAFHDLTGMDPTVPRDAARALIALSGARDPDLESL
ncbi:helix-turn-helix domain-containing protein [Leucobacter sp. NPDC015123]|uniref:helix-turn-helix domain-containing protein n=1 Tax=Leucobacter sp. NPDC015123 TaxID=3364129 RepID=UPI0036F463F1